MDKQGVPLYPSGSLLESKSWNIVLLGVRAAKTRKVFLEAGVYEDASGQQLTSRSTRPCSFHD